MNKLSAYIRLIRPFHWSKNIFVFAALIFAQHNQLFDINKVIATVYAFACFCLLSSFAYVINDIHDVELDRQHPRKKFRPLAAGQVGVNFAWFLAVWLLLLGLGGSFALNILLGFVALAYLLLNMLYSWWLKHHVIVDVMCISIGFVLRALAGVVAIEVPLSPWLLVCTFTLCLFVGFGKRRCELAVTNNNYHIASDRRPVLERYTIELLGHLLTISAGLAITTFMLYTMDTQTAQKFGTNYLVYSLPFVFYGIFRFASLIQTGRFGGPMEIFAIDRPFQLSIVLWIVSVVIIVHWGTQIQNIAHKMAMLY
jgi:4-hydroxybenzoate polyprenyltransferase